MNKYLLIAKNTWIETLTYRTSFVVYRLREVLQLLALYFLWFYVSGQTGNFATYSQASLITYVLVSSFVSDVVFSTRTTAIAGEINEGGLTNFLTRPLSYLTYYFARDLGDKAMNINFSIVELTVFYFIVHPPLILQTNGLTVLLFVMSLILGIVLYFFISVLISFIGFWSNEGWGPRFIFFQCVGFLAGSLLPLDVLPKNVYTIFQYLPFSYLIYFPTKLYLGQVPLIEVIKGFGILLVWIAISYLVVRYVWSKGLKQYTAQGI